MVDRIIEVARDVSPDLAKQIEERALQLQQRAYVKQMAWVFALEERYHLHPGDAIDAESGIIRRVTFDENGVRDAAAASRPTEVDDRRGVPWV